MVRFALQIKADLENVEELKSTPDSPYFVKVKCTNCGEVSDAWHDIRENEKMQQDSRNPAGHNFYMKCKMCKREITIDIVEKSINPYTEDDTGNYRTIVAFDCRGIEPVEFEPRTGFIVRSSNNGQTFEDVDLSEKEFFEYDEKNKATVGIYNITSRFINIKKQKTFL